MEYSQERKLRYIDKTVKELEKNKTRKTIDEDNFMKWFEIDKFSYKLMKNFISKEVIQYSKASVLSKDVQKIKKELDTNIKKMNVINKEKKNNIVKHSSIKLRSNKSNNSIKSKKPKIKLVKSKEEIKQRKSSKLFSKPFDKSIPKIKEGSTISVNAFGKIHVH